MIKNETSLERLNDDVDTVKGFCCLGNALNASGGFEIIVVTKTKIGQMRLHKYGEVLYRRSFSLNMKGKVYQICVRSAIIYARKT